MQNAECRINKKNQITSPEENLQSAICNLQSDERFPLVALVVSGGHTQLVLMRDHFQYEILGETEDDAVGEAFDKVARMLGLSYPGGPIVAKRADNFRMQIAECRLKNHKTEKTQILSSENSAICNLQSAITFPRPMINSGNYNFSFSGLKTSVLYFLKKNEERMKDEDFIDEVCHEFQEAVVDVLVEKSKQAIEEFQPKIFVIAGGVSANERLRNRLRNMIEEEFPDTVFSMPEFSHSLDNAAMIGAAAAFRYERMNEEQRNALNENWRTLEASASLTLSNLKS